MDVILSTSELASDKWADMTSTERWTYFCLRAFSQKMDSFFGETRFIHISQKQCASMTGISIQTINRTWPALRRKKLISYKREDGLVSTIEIFPCLGK